MELTIHGGDGLNGVMFFVMNYCFLILLKF